MDDEATATSLLRLTVGSKDSISPIVWKAHESYLLNFPLHLLSVIEYDALPSSTDTTPTESTYLPPSPLAHALPPAIHLLTLRVIDTPRSSSSSTTSSDQKTMLIRLKHLYDGDDDDYLGKPLKIDLLHYFPKIIDKFGYVIFYMRFTLFSLLWILDIL